MWKRRSRRIGGYLCIAAGVAGLLLPILPGIPFLLAGIALLGPDAPFSQWLSRKLARRRARSASAAH